MGLGFEKTRSSKQGLGVGQVVRGGAGWDTEHQNATFSAKTQMGKDFEMEGSASDISEVFPSEKSLD